MIDFYNVYKSYGKTSALKKVNIHIEKGEFVYITGPSGAGKSTLLKLMHFAELPTRGKLRVLKFHSDNLQKSSLQALRRSVMMAYQNYFLINERTVYDNVALPLKILGMPPDKIFQHVLFALSEVGLTGKQKAYPLELSGGEQQRVSLARALVAEPQILLADEPTGNLDKTAAQYVMQILQKLNLHGATIVMATHNEFLLKNYPQRTIILTNGELTRR